MLIVNRHCYYSGASANKARPAGFGREELFRTLIQGLDPKDKLVILLDDKYKSADDHFVLKYRGLYEIQSISVGSEGASFLSALERAATSSEKQVYFVEDDYSHAPNWRKILDEGLRLNPNGFVTLYDHPDKYRDYPWLASSLYLSESCWWRSTPSTTNTYACNTDALRKNLKIHSSHSQAPISTDHAKFLELAQHGQFVISSIPGYSSHVESGNESPFYDRHPNC